MDDATRRDGLQRTVSALETTTEIANAIGGEIELDRILELLVKRGRALVCARTLVVALAVGDEIEIVAAAGDVPAGLLGRRAPAEGSALGAMLRSRRQARLTDLSRRAGRVLTVDLDAEAGLMVPLLHRGLAVGVLGAFDRLVDGPGFSVDDERLLQAFAASAATAVATAQTVRSHSLQELGGLRVLLSAARRSDDRARDNAALDQAVELVTRGIANLRALITDLRPAALDEIGVQAALMALVERVRDASGLVVELDADLDFEAGRAGTRHTPDLEEAMYRVIQEAIVIELPMRRRVQDDPQRPVAKTA